MRIVAAMSGGVDSSVVAGLLHEQGHEVIGFTLQLYDAAAGRKGACCAGQDIHDARDVADRLGIAHYVIDAEARFRASVIQQFADAYAGGETPVPCVRCNMGVKFTDLLGLARDLGAELGEHVSVLLQCTDPARFHPEADEPVFREDILFVGNSRGEYRQVIRDALAVGLNPAIYGNGWRGLVPDGYVRAENVPNTRLAHEYRAARVVLNDHWNTMRRYGMISNRVFDVLACGGRLISDPVEGMEQLFGDFVRTYREPAELAALTAELQDEGPDRQAERDAFARRIMAEHGFPARAAQLDDMIRTLLARRVATAM